MTAKFSLVSVAALAVLPLPLACGGDDGPSHVITHDSSIQPDAETCTAAASFSPTWAPADLIVNNYPAAGSGSDATFHHIYFTGDLNTEAPPDQLYIDLWEQFGGFGSGDIRTGQFALTGEDAAYSSCGTCVYIANDVDPDNGPTGYYFATGGTLNLTSVTGRLTGSISNVTFVKVGIDADGLPTDEPAAGNCSSTIASASFDAPIAMGSAATGKPAVMRERARVLRHRYR